MLGSPAYFASAAASNASLTASADPSFLFHSMYGPIYPASKTGLNAMTSAMRVELEDTDIKVNLVSPEFTATTLTGFSGTDVADGSREVVRVALFGPDDPRGTFTRWENEAIPW